MCGFPGGSDGKEFPCNVGDTGSIPCLSLGQEDPLEKELETHCSVLAWRILRTAKPGGPWGGKDADTTERRPDEMVMWGGGERAARNGFSCILGEVTFDPLCLWLCQISVAAQGCSRAAAHGLPIVEASLVAKPGLLGPEPSLD